MCFHLKYRLLDEQSSFVRGMGTPLLFNSIKHVCPLNTVFLNIPMSILSSLDNMHKTVHACPASFCIPVHDTIYFVAHILSYPFEIKCDDVMPSNVNISAKKTYLQKIQNALKYLLSSTNRCSRQNIPPAKFTLAWSYDHTKRTDLAIIKTIANQNSNYLSIFYLLKPKQINKGGSFEDKICL